MKKIITLSSLILIAFLIIGCVETRVNSNPSNTKNSEEKITELSIQEKVISGENTAQVAKTKEADTHSDFPDFLAEECKNWRDGCRSISWYAVDFDYVNATLNYYNDKVFVTIRQESGEIKKLDGGIFFFNILFEDDSAKSLLESCKLKSRLCINRTWAYQMIIGGDTFTTIYCPNTQEFCRNVVKYHVEHSYNCGELKGFELRCPIENWDKDWEPQYSQDKLIIGRIIK